MSPITHRSLLQRPVFPPMKKMQVCVSAKGKQTKSQNQ